MLDVLYVGLGLFGVSSKCLCADWTTDAVSELSVLKLQLLHNG